jgi:hypothetical protein
LACGPFSDQIRFQEGESMLSKLTVTLSALAVGAPAALAGGVGALGDVGLAAIAAIVLVVLLLLVLDRDVRLRSKTSRGSRTVTLSFPKRHHGKGGAT